MYYQNCTFILSLYGHYIYPYKCIIVTREILSKLAHPFHSPYYSISLKPILCVSNLPIFHSTISFHNTISHNHLYYPISYALIIPSLPSFHTILFLILLCYTLSHSPILLSLLFFYISFSPIFKKFSLSPTLYIPLPSKYIAISHILS